MSEEQPPRRVIRVAGDLTASHRMYDGTCDNLATPGCPSSMTLELGGASVAHRILKQAELSAPAAYRVLRHCRIDEQLPRLPQCFSLWSRCHAEGGGACVWRQTRNLGTSAPDGHYYRYKASEAGGEDAGVQADVLVLDDRGLGFRHSANAELWPSELTPGAGYEGWILLHTVWPVAHGDLWRRLRSHAARLVVLVEIDELRHGEVGISRGLSWERTAEDLVTELTHNKEIADLTGCRHLIVKVGSEGALWREQRESGERYRLIFDPANLEGEWTGGVEGEVPGASSCLLAALAHRLATEPSGGAGQPAEACAAIDDLSEAVIRGLRAARRLRLAGHGVAAGDGHGVPGFPYEEVARVAAGVQTSGDSGVAARYGVADVPSADELAARQTPWSILAGADEHDGRPLFGMARLTALFGPRALGVAPYARFGKLLAVDRQEIESLRGLKTLMANYLNEARPPRPLNVAVFGAPGSGKSFGVKQIAKGLLGSDAAILEFNLSQLASPGELIGAFHQVRDEALKGVVPVVFWDEFDSRQYSWLQYLLAPMQDGRFQEGQISHPIGKCIFIFAGGTSQDFEHFGPPGDDAWRDADGLTRSERFALQKGPDFISRLNGYLNISGPNRRQRYNPQAGRWLDDNDSPDITYPVRRALLLRSADGLYGNESLETDDGLLSSFLLISAYRHGARSLETIVRLTRDPRSAALRRSGLPPEDQLGLHVDARAFTGLAVRVLDFKMHGEELAPHIHEYYRELAHRAGGGERYDVPWDELPASVREANIAAALRVTSILGHAGLTLVKKSDGQPGALTVDELRALIERRVEVMAEAEHEGWMEDKYREGWEYGPARDDRQQLHNCLRPYKELSEATKEKDRNVVRHYPELIEHAGYAAAPANGTTAAGHQQSPGGASLSAWHADS
jgi:hypothetical protein